MDDAINVSGRLVAFVRNAHLKLKPSTTNMFTTQTMPTNALQTANAETVNINTRFGRQARVGGAHGLCFRHHAFYSFLQFPPKTRYVILFSYCFPVFTNVRENEVATQYLRLEKMRFCFAYRICTLSFLVLPRQTLHEINNGDNADKEKSHGNRKLLHWKPGDKLLMGTPPPSASFCQNRPLPPRLPAVSQPAPNELRLGFGTTLYAHRKPPV